MYLMCLFCGGERMLLACLLVCISQENGVAAAVGIINAIVKLGEGLVGFLLLCKPLKQ